MMKKFEQANEANSNSKRCCELQSQPNPEEPNVQKRPEPEETNNGTGCFCQRPLRSLKPQDVEMFLPRSLPCTCNTHAGAKTDTRRPIALDRILRPWQVNFLKHEYMVATNKDLVSSYNKIGPVMANGMKKWWKKSFPFASRQDTQSCELALLIWTRTCQMAMDSKSTDGVFLYEVKSRQPCEKPKADASVPMIIRFASVKTTDEVSECSSQGASTVLEDFLEQIFTRSYFEEDPLIKPETQSEASAPVNTEPPQDWDSDTLPTAVEPIVEISNMKDVAVSMEFYKCMDRTMNRKIQDVHAAKMSSVLNKMDIHLITKHESPPGDSERSMSLVGSKPAMNHSTVDIGTETTRSTTKSAKIIPEEKVAKNIAPKRLTKRMEPPRKQQWHASLNYLAAFND